jgi:hypothetical protein
MFHTSAFCLDRIKVAKHGMSLNKETRNLDLTVRDKPSSTHANTHPQFNPIISILILNYGSHFKAVFESTGDMVCRLARLHRTLNACSHPLSTENTYQRPATLLQMENKILPN